MASDQKKYNELRKKVEYQVACEEKAYRIVERLIENPVSLEFFQDSLNFITPSHYNDIVEERAVSKLCGYPLCPNSLEKVLKQKYMISTKTNKVYNIEGRKNFCSGKCYEASLHVEKQISSTPLWTRKKLPPTTFTFLSLDMQRGKAGEEVIMTMANDLKEEIKTIEKMDKYQQNLKERKAKVGDNQVTGHSRSVGDERVSSPSLPNDTTEKGKTYVYTLDRALRETGMGGEEDLADQTAGCDEIKGDYEISVDVVSAAVQHGESENATHNIHDDLNQKYVNGEEVKVKVDNSSGNVNARNIRTLQDDIQTSNIEDQLNPEVAIREMGDSNVIDRSEKMKTANKDTTHPPDTVEKTVSKERLSGKQKKVKSKGGNSQTEYLMKLLDKRKALLSKMADIQPSGVASPLRVASDCDKEIPKTSDVVTDTVKVDNDNIKGLRTETNMVKQIDTSTVNSPEPPVQRIIEVLKSWITTDSLEYLKVENSSEATLDKSQFDKQYKALVAKVDAQERDFDNLLGEVSMEQQEDTMKATVPDYEQIRKEMEENYQKVNAFMKGKITYKVEEKITSQEVAKMAPEEVNLPTVDRYNQMLIRQKIVLERISKVLPDLLTPLHLLVQDVFTELRELVSTFKLTSENILFKPAEWSLVTLILLKLLCGKVKPLQKSFVSPGAESYFEVLLQAVNCDLNSLDKLVVSLLTR